MCVPKKAKFVMNVFELRLRCTQYVLFLLCCGSRVRNMCNAIAIKACNFLLKVALSHSQ